MHYTPGETDVITKGHMGFEQRTVVIACA